MRQVNAVYPSASEGHMRARRHENMQGWWLDLKLVALQYLSGARRPYLLKIPLYRINLDITTPILSNALPRAHEAHSM